MDERERLDSGVPGPESTSWEEVTHCSFLLPLSIVIVALLHSHINHRSSTGEGMSGGFILPPSSHTTSSDVREVDGDTKPTILPDPLLKLSERQERRLRTHLDDRLGQLERDSKTQYAPFPFLLPPLPAVFFYNWIHTLNIKLKKRTDKMIVVSVPSLTFSKD